MLKRNLGFGGTDLLVLKPYYTVVYRSHCRVGGNDPHTHTPGAILQKCVNVFKLPFEAV